MGLNTGPVPARVDACVKAGLLDLLDHAAARGWSRRRGCGLLDLDENRAARWAHRRAADPGGGLDDAAPGGHLLHGLLDAEREAVLVLFESWGEVDRSHRKLAHRGSRLGLVDVSESTVRRVLADQGMVLPGPAPREPAEKTPWPDWLEWKPNRIWAYDFTHFPRAKRAAIAVLDMVSRKWIATLVSPEETSTQVEACFLSGLENEGLLDLVDQRATTALREALLSGEAERIETVIDDAELPMLLAVSDNGRRCARTRPGSSWPGCTSPSTSAARTPRPTKPGSRRSSATSRASGPTWRRSPTPASSTPSSPASATTTTPCDFMPRSATSLQRFAECGVAHHCGVADPVEGLDAVDDPDRVQSPPLAGCEDAGADLEVEVTVRVARTGGGIELPWPHWGTVPAAPENVHLRH